MLPTHHTTKIYSLILNPSYIAYIRISWASFHQLVGFREHLWHSRSCRTKKERISVVSRWRATSCTGWRTWWEQTRSHRRTPTMLRGEHPPQIGVPTITHGRNKLYYSTHVIKGRLKQYAKHKWCWWVSELSLSSKSQISLKSIHKKETLCSHGAQRG